MGGRSIFQDMAQPLYNHKIMVYIFCPNCWNLFNIVEEIDEEGNTAEFDTVLKYVVGEIYEDVVCDKCDQTFNIKKIKQDKWESFIQLKKWDL